MQIHSVGIDLGKTTFHLAQYVAMKPTIQLATHTELCRWGDTAVLSAIWRFHGTTTDGGDVSSSGTSIEVARREPDGSWRYLIDLPYGLG